MSFLALDAQALYTELQRGVQSLCTASTQLVGVHSGGAWLAERLQCDLQRAGSHGTISSVMHRDDYARRGLSAGGQTQLPFDVNGADILILDDVLYTGRTIRAYMGRIRNLARAVAQSYLDSRARLGFPMAPKDWATEALAQIEKKAA